MTEEKTVNPPAEEAPVPAASPQAAPEAAPAPAAEPGDRSMFAKALEESLRKEKARRFRKGDRVSGKVYRLGETMAFVDLGGRSEGMLDLKDVRRPDGTLEIEEGSEIDAIVLDVAANGVLLKRTLGRSKESAEQIVAAWQAGIPVQARVTGINKGGLELDLFGFRAFCPGSQVDLRKVDDLSSFNGQTLSCRIMEVKENGKTIVLSRRALLQEEQDKRVAEAKAKIAPGAVLKGTVVRLQPFGVFVDVGGVEGLVHVSELSRGRVTDPAEVVKVGDEIEVQVLKVEQATDKSGRPVDRIALSRKALEKDPWAEAAARFAVGSKIAGKIARIQPFGAFVELAPGIDGLIHISEMSDRRIAHPKDVVSEGAEVQVTVLAVEPERKRIALSMRDPAAAAARAEEAEERPRPARRRDGDHGERGERRARREGGEGGGERRPERPKYDEGAVLEGTVEKIEAFGVFVTLPGGGRALVPNMELGTERGADHRKLFPVGSTLKVALIASDRRGQLRASKLEAEKSEERAAVREWASTQKGAGTGFGTSMADLLRKANLVK